MRDLHTEMHEAIYGPDDMPTAKGYQYLVVLWEGGAIDTFWTSPSIAGTEYDDEKLDQMWVETIEEARIIADQFRAEYAECLEDTEDVKNLFK